MIKELNGAQVQGWGQEVLEKHLLCFLLVMLEHMDYEDDVVYLPADTTRIVDIGDADIIHTDTKQSHANI